MSCLATFHHSSHYMAGSWRRIGGACIAGKWKWRMAIGARLQAGKRGSL